MASAMIQSATELIAGSATHLISVDDGDAAWSDAHANFLSSLLDAERQDLLTFARRRTLKPREYLFQAGDHSGDVYILAIGCVRQFQISPTGKETILWFNFPGEVFGLAELSSGIERQINAVANDASEVLCVRRTDFIQFLGKHPEAAMKAIGILSARVRAFGYVLAGLTLDNVETRIARLLMRFAAVSSQARCSVKVEQEEVCVNVRLRHQDIANLIGASRQTVTSTLLSLRRRDAIRMEGHHIHIMNPSHFQHLIEQSAS